jgi:hypothetical protein
MLLIQIKDQERTVLDDFTQLLRIEFLVKHNSDQLADKLMD